MSAGTDTATPDAQHDSGEPAGNRYRLAKQAKQLAHSHAVTLARLDEFEDTLRDPATALAAADPSRRNPNRPVPVSPGPTPMPGFSDGAPELGADADPSRQARNPSPADQRRGVVGVLLTLLLGVLLSWIGAELLRPMIDGGPLWPVVAHVPGVLLVLALAGSGAAVATAVATRLTPAAASSGNAPEEGPGEQASGVPVSRGRFVAALLLYLATLGTSILWTVLWSASVVGTAESGGTVFSLAVGLLVAVVALAILPAQLRRARAAARAGWEQGGAPWDGDGALPDLGTWARALRRRRRERRRRRRRARARSAVVEHTRAWEDVHHECQRHADTDAGDSAAARAALRALGSVRPATPETESGALAMEVGELDLTGNMATVVRSLARSHPSSLEARLDRISRAFRTEAGAPDENEAA